MKYEFDPDLVPHVDLMTGADLSDLAAMRAWVYEMWAEAAGSATRDPSVGITEKFVPGPVDGPDVMVRVHTPDGHRIATSGHCCTSTAAPS